MKNFLIGLVVMVVVVFVLLLIFQGIGWLVLWALDDKYQHDFFTEVMTGMITFCLMIIALPFIGFIQSIGESVTMKSNQQSDK